MDFKLVSDYAPTGDQPEAIAQLLASIRHGSKHNTLLGVTGSGKTFTVANVISQLNRPTLVLSHNKTLAAQLYGEFKNFFPENAVEYFVSYYDYYQPEAYLPSTDTYIEKDLSINDEIEKMRLSTTATLLSGRRDVIVVSSVSCLYGCGNPSDFHSMAIHIEVGEILNYKQFLYKLVEALYTRTERELTPATFRVTGDTIDIMAAFGEFGNQCFRVTFFDNEVESIQSIDPVTGQRIQTLDALTLYPVSLFVTTKERIHTAVQQIYLDLGKQIAFFEQAGRPAEAQRIKQRVEYDLEMIKELGYCPRHRELLPLFRRTCRRDATLLPAGLFSAGLPDGDRREPRHAPPGARHVRRRPRPQGEPRGVRVPSSRSQRQPAAPLRGVRTTGRHHDLRERHTGRLRTDEERRSDRRTVDPADRTG